MKFKIIHPYKDDGEKISKRPSIGNIIMIDGVMNRIKYRRI